MDKHIYQLPAKLLDKRFSIESFEKYFLHSNQNMKEINKLIKNCNVDQTHCRFNIWRLCLGVVSNDSIQKKKQSIQFYRHAYKQKKSEALKLFNKSSPVREQKKNPLMMMGGKTQSKQTESDDFLKQQIQKDVERTYQEIPFFQNKDVLKLLNLVLFVWCRRNPEVSYKQGMNELLASVVVCYFQEAEFRKENQKPEELEEELWKTHLYFNSVQHAQQDIYSVFQKIIDIQGDMYKTQADQGIKEKVNPNSKNNTPILQRIIQIKDHKLKHIDLQLFRIIKLQDVQTKCFMLRWIRCMHTREFSLENSFVIWDSIFLEFMESPESKKKGQFEFIDAMCLAMFIYMRSIVLAKETAGQILQVYQKYPALKRGQYLDELITLAWTVCEQLRLLSANANNQNQSNEIDVSDKFKDLKLMKKTTHQQKSQIQQKPKPQPMPVPQPQTIQKKQSNLIQKKKEMQKQQQSATRVKDLFGDSIKQQQNESITKTEPTQNKPIKNLPGTLSIERKQLTEILNSLKQSLNLLMDDHSKEVKVNLQNVVKKIEEKLK